MVDQTHECIYEMPSDLNIDDRLDDAAADLPDESDSVRSESDFDLDQSFTPNDELEEVADAKQAEITHLHKLFIVTKLSAKFEHRPNGLKLRRKRKPSVKFEKIHDLIHFYEGLCQCA